MLRPASLGLALLMAAASQAGSYDAKGAQAAASQGEAFQAAKNYPAALAALQKALELNPAETHPGKLMGDVYVQMRQYAKAVDAYEAYLACSPSDLGTQAFLESAKLKRAAALIPHGANIAGGRLHTDLMASAEAMPSRDIIDFVTNQDNYGLSGPASMWGSGLSLGLGYLVGDAYDLGLAFSMGPYRSATFTQSLTQSRASLSLLEWSVTTRGAWLYRQGPHTFEFGLSAGAAWLQGRYDYHNGLSDDASAVSSFSALGVILEAGLLYEYRLSPGWGICLGLAERLAKFGPVTSPSTGEAPLKYSNGNGNVNFDDSGFCFSLGLRRYFGGKALQP